MVLFGSLAEAHSPSRSACRANHLHFFLCQSSPCTVTTVLLPNSRGKKENNDGPMVW